MKKRYQIFVSSTFTDLEIERGKVMQTILNFDCFPAGMELFPTIGVEQFEYIKRIIDDSDYYLLIVGGRYGDEDDDGVSWTEKEYDYAVSKQIPIMAFILHDKAYNQLPQNKIDQKDTDKKREKLKSFKSKVKKGRLVKFWTNVDDLDAAVAKSLPIVKELQPQIGWIRADRVVSCDAPKEIDRLNNEITTYQNQVKKLEADLKKKDEDCDSLLKKSKKEAQQEIKNFQKKVEQLQNEYDELKAQKEKCNNDRLAVEQSYQEKVNDVAGDLEKVLNKLKGNTEPKKLHLPIKTISIPGTNVSFKMVLVEGGTFMMGANDSDDDAFDDERPAHEVTLSDYYIGETQVTQALWQAVMGENPSEFQDDPNLPVENVDWDDCQEFLEKLNELTGLSFRLPTEAQWEFAARGGNKSNGYKYAGSNDIKKVAWYSANAKKTHVVSQKNANELGLYDMNGNVWEWCQDSFRLYGTNAQNDSDGNSTLFKSVIRGGSWRNNAMNCRVTLRSSADFEYWDSGLGLRLAL